MDLNTFMLLTLQGERTMEHIPGNSFDKHVYYSKVSEDITGKSFIFETLLALATETVESYRSDFYHDAIFISGLKMDKAFTFYYLFGDTGTTIISKGQSNLSPEGLALQCRKYSRPFVYRVELISPEKKDSQAWTIRYTCLATIDTPMPSYNERVSFNYAALCDQRKPS